MRRFTILTRDALKAGGGASTRHRLSHQVTLTSGQRKKGGQGGTKMYYINSILYRPRRSEMDWTSQLRPGSGPLRSADLATVYTPSLSQLLGADLWFARPLSPVVSRVFTRN